MALVTPAPATCVALATLEDALVWLARNGAAGIAVRLRALGRFDRDGLVSVRAFDATLEGAATVELVAARDLPHAFPGLAAQALRDGAGAALARRAGAV
jgi:hypothetical protein